MDAISPRIVRAGLLLALTLLTSAATGCATSPPGNTSGQAPSVSALGVKAYQPIRTYRPAPPPTLHFVASGGMGAIRAGLMNQMR
jgi:hypothetical protein